jgi:hypothetical protein
MTAAPQGPPFLLSGQNNLMSANELISNLERLGDEFLTMIQPLADEQAIRAAQAQFLGKKGKLTEAMKELGKLPASERPLVGAAVNKLKQSIETQTAKKLDDLANVAARADLARKVDVTLPARPAGGGHLHLLTQVRLEAVQTSPSSASSSPRVRRSRPTGTRSRRSRSRRIIPRATCRTRSTCPRRSCCVRTRVPCRCGRC